MLFLSRICFYSVNFSRTFCFLCLEMKSNIVYARAKAAILRPSGHSVSKEIAKFFTRRNVGANNWSKRESASNTNQEADDRLFWPIVLENQSRKRSTNTTISEMRQSVKVMVWAAMTVRGLTKLHMLPTGQTLTSEYYFNQSLEKEVKPFITSRRQVTGGPIERKLV